MQVKFAEMRSYCSAFFPSNSHPLNVSKFFGGKIYNVLLISYAHISQQHI